MDLLNQIKDKLRVKKLTAADRYIEILHRIDCPKDQDAEELMKVMAELGRHPEDIENDAKLLADAERCRAIVVQMPEGAAANAHDTWRRRVANHQLTEAVAAAQQAHEEELARIKADFAAGVNLFHQAQNAEVELGRLMPELQKILGHEGADTAFCHLYDPQAVNGLHSELRKEYADQLK
ncbi:MAG: hypothetical protein QUV05_08130 [Phycisphaerae bacterium]|nr:hypothetical protein [Phycisphaerae bacterium]